MRQRLPAGVAAALLNVAAIYGLIAVFAGGLALPDRGDISLLSVLITRPMPQPPPKQALHDHGGAPMPAAKRAIAAPAIAAAIIPVSTPIPAATIAAAGNGQTNGSALSGQGAGGGGAGQGAGGGSGDGADGGTDLRQIDGGIYEDDYPREAVRAHQSGNVHIRFTVGTNGRVSDCTVTRSSGSASLDEATCRLILRRFRYEPARDAQGRPHADTVEGVHEWRVGGSATDDLGADGP